MKSYWKTNISWSILVLIRANLSSCHDAMDTLFILSHYVLVPLYIRFTCHRSQSKELKIKYLITEILKHKYSLMQWWIRSGHWEILTEVSKAINLPTKEMTDGDDRSKCEQTIIKTRYKAVFGSLICFLICLYFLPFCDSFKEDWLVSLIF